MKYLRKEEWIETAKTLSPGQFIRINHNTEECNGDSKSLKIERKYNGDLVAHCFRCGKSGSSRENFSRALAEQKERVIHGRSDREDQQEYNSVVQRCRANNLFAERITDPSGWPLKARVWVRQYGITDEECRDNNIVWVPSKQRIGMFQMSPTGEILAYQLRKVYDEDPAPKILSHTLSPTIIHHNNVGGTTLVLVEDLLSSIKVGRYADCIPLFSTSLSDKTLAYISAQGYKEVLVWLDNDKPQVIKDAQRIVRRIENIGLVGRMATQKSGNPKSYSDKDIEDLLKGRAFSG